MAVGAVPAQGIPRLKGCFVCCANSAIPRPEVAIHRVGNPVVGLGLPWMLDWQAQYWIQMASFGRDQLLGPLGGLYQGTNELIGEDLGMIIRFAPVPVMELD